ncbi:MAG: SCP2 sterol-binding domain-containing protein [Acidimicrobiales bacterium]
MPRTKTDTRAPAGNDEAVEAFFADLSTRGSIPLLRDVKGTIRFDVSSETGVKRWAVTLQEGEVAVSNRNAKADAVVAVDRTLFNEIAEGRKNAMAAVIRGAMVITGDMRMVLAFQRFFPGSLGSKGRVPPIPEVEQNR